ncbi:endolytic transglycosylase MltG [bacterium]|nr:endolytic transglycosylase MltG [bacterium]
MRTATVLGIVAALIAAFFYAISRPLAVLHDGLVEIPPGAGLSVITGRFFGGQAGSGMLFKAHVVLTGASRRLQAGEYQLSKDSIRSLTQKLLSGKVHLYRLTVAEGIWATDIVTLLAESGLADRDRLLDLIHDPAFARELLGFDAPGLEGYLFPETYFFSKGMKEDEILRVFVRRFREKTGGLLESDTAHAVVTLASLVEREARMDEERALIAGVFLNRLKRRMPLESCPTVEYALGRKKMALSQKDIAVDSPYNTYRRAGLPPGPVANPGLAAIRSVLAPAETRALFFVARGDGRHIFSETLAAHNRAKAQVRKMSGRKGEREIGR